MIVWSGRGFLSVVVLFATFVLCNSFFSRENADYSFIITAFVTGLFSWFFGKKWNTQNEKIVINEETGQRIKIKNNHSLFWIPMQYCGIIFTIIGIIILFQNSFVFGLIASFVFAAIFTIPFFTKQRVKQENNRNPLPSNKDNDQNKETNTEDFISQLKKDKTAKKDFEPSDHTKFIPK